MKTSVIKCVLLVAMVLLVSGCSCAIRIFGGEPKAREAAISLRDVHFAYNSAKLSPSAKRTLREDYENLGLGNATYSAKILLEGHADERGTAAYNQKLSKKRVAEVRKYLKSLGIKEAQFESRDLGEESPIAQGSNPEAWAKNRTVRVLAM